VVVIVVVVEVVVVVVDVVVGLVGVFVGGLMARCVCFCLSLCVFVFVGKRRDDGKGDVDICLAKIELHTHPSSRDHKPAAGLEKRIENKTEPSVGKRRKKIPSVVRKERMGREGMTMAF
jgi:hypothetical protein